MLHPWMFIVLTNFEMLLFNIFMCNPTDENWIPDDYQGNAFPKQRSNFISGSPSISRSLALSVKCS